MLLRTLAVSLSALLTAAHFLRRGETSLVVVCLLVPLLLLIPRRWALRTVQLALLAAAARWAATAVGLVGQRMAAGEPWMRLVLILGAVTALALGSAVLLQNESVLRRYARRRSSS
jgi:hypothetical protein